MSRPSAPVTPLRVFAGGASPPVDFGIIQMRHVRTNAHEAQWRHAYASIRAHYPHVPLVIIDDGSDRKRIASMASTTRADDSTSVVENVAHPGAAEIVAYAYLREARPFQKALVLHDSMMVREPLAPPDEPIRFLWHFRHQFDRPHEEMRLLLKLPSRKRTRLYELYVRKHRWWGCFGSAAFVSLDAVDRVQKEHQYFDLLRHVRDRAARLCMERVFACVMTYEFPSLELRPSLFGDILKYPRTWGYSFEQFLEEGEPRFLPIVKVWCGR